MIVAFLCGIETIRTPDIAAYRSKCCALSSAILSSALLLPLGSVWKAWTLAPNCCCCRCCCSCCCCRCLRCCCSFFQSGSNEGGSARSTLTGSSDCGIGQSTLGTECSPLELDLELDLREIDRSSTVVGTTVASNGLPSVLLNFLSFAEIKNTRQGGLGLYTKMYNSMPTVASLRIDAHYSIHLQNNSQTFFTPFFAICARIQTGIFNMQPDAF